MSARLGMVKPKNSTRAEDKPTPRNWGDTIFSWKAKALLKQGRKYHAAVVLPAVRSQDGSLCDNDELAEAVHGELASCVNEGDVSWTISTLTRAETRVEQQAVIDRKSQVSAEASARAQQLLIEYNATHSQEATGLATEHPDQSGGESLGVLAYDGVGDLQETQRLRCDGAESPELSEVSGSSPPNLADLQQSSTATGPASTGNPHLPPPPAALRDGSFMAQTMSSSAACTIAKRAAEDEKLRVQQRQAELEAAQEQERRRAADVVNQTLGQQQLKAAFKTLLARNK